MPLQGANVVVRRRPSQASRARDSPTPDEIGVTIWIRGRPLRWAVRGALLAGSAIVAALVRVILKQ